MVVITVFLLFPLAAALAIFLVKNDAARSMLVRVSAAITALLTLVVVGIFFKDGIRLSCPIEEIDLIILAVEVMIAAYIITLGIRSKKYVISIFSFLQTAAMLVFEFGFKEEITVETAVIFDKLTAIMILVIGLVGSLICIYAVGYMKDYHNHHKEYKERKSFFFSILFLFLSAMFGIVLSNNLLWMYFCWEITTLCSFLLIGYTQTEEAKNNALKALRRCCLCGCYYFYRHELPHSGAFCTYTDES
jgi:ech hydrogenase subunit A